MNDDAKKILEALALAEEAAAQRHREVMRAIAALSIRMDQTAKEATTILQGTQSVAQFLVNKMGPP